MVAEKLMDTTNKLKIDVIKKWIDSKDEGNSQFLTDDDIIQVVMTEEKNDGGNDDDKRGEAVTVQNLFK